MTMPSEVSATEVSFESAFDRLNEAHWHIHQMALYYHHADPFRFSLASFLRALKEVPQIITMEAQRHESLRRAWRDQLAQLAADPLVSRLAKWRDIVVHKEMILPQSSAQLGSGTHSRIKVALGAQIDPRSSSDLEMAVLVKATNPDFDPLHILVEDEDYLPGVWREWRLHDLPEKNVLMLASEAWTVVGKAFVELERLLGREAPASLTLNCVHEPGPRLYPRALLQEGRAKLDRGATVEEVAAFLRREMGP